jgi:hypothetical protein
MHTSKRAAARAGLDALGVEGAAVGALGGFCVTFTRRRCKDLGKIVGDV